MDKNKTKLINELKKFKNDNKISKLIFFGSRATNKYSKYSDVDLIIISPMFKRYKSFKRAPTLRPKWKLDYPVDMLCYTPEEFEKKQKQTGIIQMALKEGILIK